MAKLKITIEIDDNTKMEGLFFSRCDNESENVALFTDLSIEEKIMVNNALADYYQLFHDSIREEAENHGAKKE